MTTSEQRVQHFLSSDRADWYHHVNVTAHDHGGHFIPWELPNEWVEDLPRTFRGRPTRHEASARGGAPGPERPS